MVCYLKNLFCILQDHPPEGGTPMEAEGGAKSPAASKVLYYSAVQPHGFILSKVTQLNTLSEIITRS